MKKSVAIFTLLAAATGVAMAQALTVPAAAPAPPAGPAAVPASPSTAKIQFAEPIHDAGKISAGAVVKHEFKFTNKGTSTLELTDVRPSCGCTTAGEFTRKVEPGMEGSIPIQFNSANFSGQVMKTVTVTCNDTSQPTVVLQVKASIWKPIEVTPAYAMFNIVDGSTSNEVRTVKIVNNMDEPMTVSEPVVTNSAFKAELKAIKPGKEFEVLIQATPPSPQQRTVSSQITLKTSSTNMPVVVINAFATVQPALMLYPNQVNLPAGPLATPTPFNVMLRNNANTPVSITNATVNAEGVEVKLTEGQAGRFFTMALKFPQGFQVPPGQKVELTFNTSHPSFQKMTVPIMQMQRPVMAPVAPAVKPPTTPRPVLYGPPAPPRQTRSGPAPTLPPPLPAPRS